MSLKFGQKSLTGMEHQRYDLENSQILRKSTKFLLKLLTCSKISASKLMNLICCSEMACSTRSCGRICANESSALTQTTSRCPFVFSKSMIEFTRPLTISWHEWTSVRGISFFPFCSSFLLSFGSKTCWRGSFKNKHFQVFLFLPFEEVRGILFPAMTTLRR